MNHIPHTHPIVQPQLVPAANPPVVAPVNVPQWLGNIAPVATGTVINHVVNKMQSGGAARIYHFNVLSMNGFQNPVMQETVQMSVQLLAINLIRNQVRSRETALEEAVDQTITMLLGSLITTVPELRSVVPQQAVHQAYQSAQALVGAKAEIQHFVSTGQINNPPGQSPAQPGWGAPAAQPGWGQAPAPAPAAPTWGAPAQPGWGTSAPVAPPGWGQPAPGWGAAAAPAPTWGAPAAAYPVDTYGRPITTPPGWGQPAQQGWGEPVASWAHPAASPVAEAIQVSREGSAARANILSERFSTQFSSVYAPPTPAPAPPPTQLMPSTFTAAAEEPIWSPEELGRVKTDAFSAFAEEPKFIEIEGGNEMNRANHAIVYDGQTIEAPSAQFDRFRKDAMNLEATTVEPGDDVDTSDQQVNPAVHHDTNVANMLFELRRKYVKHRDSDPKSTTVMRYFGRVSNPFVGRETIKRMMAELRASNSLTALASHMRMRMGVCLKRKQDGDEHEISDNIAFLNTMDATFTQRINNFLRYSLKGIVRIDSFATDFDSIGPIVEEDLGVKCRHKWDAFCAELLLRWENSFNDVLRETLEPDEEGQHTVMMPSTLSFTFVNMSMRELGYKITTQPEVIDRLTCPALFAMAVSLGKHKKQMLTDTDIDYLVTGDGMLYRFERDLSVEGDNTYTVHMVET